MNDKKQKTKYIIRAVFNNICNRKLRNCFELTDYPLIWQFKTIDPLSVDEQKIHSQNPIINDSY